MGSLLQLVPDPVYWWSDETTARVYEHAERWATAPGVGVLLALPNRPSIAACRKMIVVAHMDGLAFRLGESGPFVLRTPWLFRGFTYIPGGLWERWESAFQAALALAQSGAK